METLDGLKKEALDICISKRRVLKYISQIILQYENLVGKDFKKMEEELSSLDESFRLLDSIITKLHNKAILDFTSLYSKSYLEERIDLLAAETNLAFLMGDVDNFQQYNKDYGHLQGDVALKTIANQFRESLEKQIIADESLFIARYGGEEFCAFIGNYNRGIHVLYQIAENLKKDIERIEIPTLSGIEILNDKYKHRTITIAVGIRKENEPINSLMLVVDNLLKDKSKKGRNRVYLRR